MIVDRRELRYVTFQNDLPEGWSAKEYPPFDLAIPLTKNWKTCSKRIIFVLEYVDRSDLRSKALLDRGTGSTILTNLISFVRKQATLIDPSLKDESIGYAAINFDFFKTSHLKGTRKHQANEFATRRVQSFIKKMDPTNIIVFGDEAAAYLLPDVTHLKHKRGWVHTLTLNNKQVLVSNTIKYNNTYFLKGVDLGTTDNSNIDEVITESNILGYISRNMLSAFLNRLPFSLDHIKPNGILIDTMSKFRRLMRLLYRSPVIAIDTETRNLSVHNNQLLTIQFTDSPDRSFVLPYQHKDTPFSSANILIIREELRKYFSQKKEWRLKEPHYLIMQNAKFDLRIIRQELDIPFIYWPVWDTMAGAFCLDENIKILFKYNKTNAYNLAQIFSSFGNAYYYNATFSKDERHDIANRDLSEVLDYCGMDVQACFGIHNSQLEQASFQKIGSHNYRPYFKRLVLTQMSDTIHVMSGMEHTGAHLDIEYLRLLRDRKKSPILSKLAEITDSLYKSKYVINTNDILHKIQGSPSGGGIFGKASWIFDPNKILHKQTLFIDVMKLEPLNKGVGDVPSIDAAFQKKYKSYKEVASFTTISKLKKLLSTYINPFYKKIGESDDGKIDHRLRPSYGFVNVVTGRSNSSKPSLQQTPQRGPDAAFIKRSFTAKEGTLNIKLDYAAHEVRCWGIMSKDNILATMFKIVHNLRLRYRQDPTEKHKSDLEKKGDPHKLNYQFFTGTPVLEVTDEQRADSKGITFGTMYGKSDRSLARDTGKSVKEMSTIKKNFFSKFAKAGKWIDWTCAFSEQNLYTFNPLGLKRNLYAYMTELPSLTSAMKRRAANCITGDHIIDTNLGLIPIKNLVDVKRFSVKVEDGSYKKSLGGCVSRGKRFVITVKLGQGITLTGTKDHEIRVLNPDLTLGWKQLGDLKEGDWCVQQRAGGKSYEEPLPPNTYGLTEMNPQLARLLGYLTAKGSVGRHNKALDTPNLIVFTNKDPELLEDYTTLMSKLFNLSVKLDVNRNSTSILRINDKNLFNFLVNIGMLGSQLEREVPRYIMQGSRSIRIAYLRALMEGNGYRSGKYVGIQLSNKLLVDQVQMLLQSLNIVPSRKSRPAKSIHIAGHEKISNCAPSHILQIDGHSFDTYCRVISFISSTKKQSMYSIIRDYGPLTIKRITSRMDNIPYAYSIFNEATDKRTTFNNGNSNNSYYKGRRCKLHTCVAKKSVRRVLNESPEVLDDLSYILGEDHKGLQMLRYINDSGMFFLPVEESNGVETEENVYDIIGVDKFNQFSANSVIVSNSPIQGLGSQLGFSGARLFSKLLYESLQELYPNEPKPTNLYPSMMVHDSIEIEVSYKYVPLVLRLLEYSTTVGVEHKISKIFGLKFNVGLAVDFELGVSGNSMKKWDYTKVGLLTALLDSLKFQRIEIGYDVNEKEVLTMIMKEGRRIAPWLDKHFPLNTNMYEGVE